MIDAKIGKMHFSCHDPKQSLTLLHQRPDIHNLTLLK